LYAFALISGGKQENSLKVFIKYSIIITIILIIAKAIIVYINELLISLSSMPKHLKAKIAMKFPIARNKL